MKLTVNHPHVPKGEEIGISGLAAVPNGDSVELDSETVKLYEEENGSIKEALANNPFATVTGEDLKKKAARLAEAANDDEKEEEEGGEK